jgi:glycine/D-amino acid oxidase-like deaminating enzyme
VAKPDVLVVGGGIMGLMSAIQLREAGVTVTLLEP